MVRPTHNGKYVWIWEKYRPAILKKMIDASEDKQDYKLSKHEFLDSNNKRPTGYSFSFVAHRGRSESDLKKSLTAQDLLYVLKCSDKAMDLMNDAHFEFKLDKDFVLHITKQ